MQRISLALLLLTAGAACTNTGSFNPDQAAEVSIRYVAISDGDDGFRETVPLEENPPRIALDSKFFLSVDDTRESHGPTAIHAASVKTLDIAPDGLTRTLRPGLVGVIVREGTRLLDFVNLDVREIATIDIENDRTLLVPNEELVLRARPLDISKAALLGSLACTWTSSAPTVVAARPNTETNGSRLRVLAASSGSSRIDVTCGKHEAHLDLVVAKVAP